MTGLVVRAEVTLDDIIGATAWAYPVTEALVRLTGQPVMVDRDPDGYVATIGDGAWVLVVDLPPAVSRWLDRAYEEDARTLAPFAFELEVPGWVFDLVAVTAR